MSGVGTMGMAEPPGEEFADFCFRGLVDRHNRLVDRLDVLDALNVLDARKIDPRWWQDAGHSARLGFSPLAMADSAMESSYRQWVDVCEAGQVTGQAAAVAIERWLVTIRDAQRWTFEAERLMGEVKRRASADAHQEKKTAKRNAVIWEEYDNQAAKAESHKTKLGLVQRTADATVYKLRTVERSLAERRNASG